MFPALKSGKCFSNFPCWLLAAFFEVPTVSLVAFWLPCSIQCTGVYITDSAVDLWGKSLSQHLAFKAAGKRQSFHLYWSDLSTCVKALFDLTLCFIFLSGWLGKKSIIKTIISAGNMGVWEPRFYYQWSYLELVGVFWKLGFSMSDRITLKVLGRFFRTHRLIFSLHSESHVFTGSASHRLWWEEMLSFFRNKKFTIFFLLFHGTCCALIPNSVLKEYKILFHAYSTK